MAFTSLNSGYTRKSSIVRRFRPNFHLSIHTLCEVTPKVLKITCKQELAVVVALNKLFKAGNPALKTQLRQRSCCIHSSSSDLFSFRPLLHALPEAHLKRISKTLLFSWLLKLKAYWQALVSMHYSLALFFLLLIYDVVVILKIADRYFTD